MGAVSLITTAAALGKTSGEIRLSDLRSDGYTRTLAGSGYYRVNPFEVAAGRAQDPDEAGTEHRLGDWDGYTHSTVVAGSDLAHELHPAEIHLSWTAPTGFDSRVCRYLVYWKAGTQSAEPVTVPVNVDDSGSTASHVISTASVGQNLAVSVLAEFDDNTNQYLSAEFPVEVSENDLTGGDIGIWTDPVPAATPSLPTVEQISPAPGDCTVETSCTFRVSISTFISGYAKTLEYELNNSGTWFTLTSGLTGGTYDHSGITFSGDTYRYRVKYNDGKDNYSSESAPIIPLCGPE